MGDFLYTMNLSRVYKIQSPPPLSEAHCNSTHTSLSVSQSHFYILYNILSHHTSPHFISKTLEMKFFTLFYLVNFFFAAAVFSAPAHKGKDKAKKPSLFPCLISFRFNFHCSLNLTCCKKNRNMHPMALFSRASGSRHLFVPPSYRH